MNKELFKLIQAELTEDEVRALCKEKKDELGFDIEKAIFPLNPLLIDEPLMSIDDAVCLVEQWASVGGSVLGSAWDSVRDSVECSVWDSVRDSVGGSVWDSVWYSVRSSVRDSVWASVRASVGAYISSIFYGVEDWKYIDHEVGVNPFKPAIDLWEAGYIASFDGDKWRLHCGKDAKVVWEGSFGH